MRVEPRESRAPGPGGGARQNEYAAADGLSAAQVRRVVRRIAGRVPVTSATFAAYDPAFDPHGRMARTTLDLLLQVAELHA